MEYTEDDYILGSIAVSLIVKQIQKQTKPKAKSISHWLHNNSHEDKECVDQVCELFGSEFVANMLGATDAVFRKHKVSIYGIETVQIKEIDHKQKKVHIEAISF